MKIITSTPDLASFCRSARQFDFVTVDTEFMREATYWPVLCLVQIATPDEAVIVDPFADDIDLSPMFDLFADRTVTKVFHAARQDVEIFVRLSGEPPAPLFDTQIAAAVCGFGDSVAYDSMVRQICGHQIDKSSRFTNWSLRPLTDKQLLYAIGDVVHLRECYTHLRNKLDLLDRYGWINPELEALMDRDTYLIRPENAWKRMKIRVNRPRVLAAMQALAAWREARAQRDNVPRGRVIKDDAISELSLQQPTTPSEFRRLRSFSQGYENSAAAKEIMTLLEEVKRRDKQTLPKISKKPNSRAPKGAIDDLLRVLLKAVSESEGIAPRLIASSDDINSIVLDDKADVPALNGWRRKIFGEKALAVKHGKLALAATRNGIVSIEADV